MIKYNKKIKREYILLHPPLVSLPQIHDDLSFSSITVSPITATASCSTASASCVFSQSNVKVQLLTYFLDVLMHSIILHME
jgi:hypothetical protein